jgi:hypothetical protein
LEISKGELSTAKKKKVLQKMRKCINKKKESNLTSAFHSINSEMSLDEQHSSVVAVRVLTKLFHQHRQQEHQQQSEFLSAKGWIELVDAIKLGGPAMIPAFELLLWNAKSANTIAQWLFAIKSFLHPSGGAMQLAGVAILDTVKETVQLHMEYQNMAYFRGGLVCEDPQHARSHLPDQLLQFGFDKHSAFITVFSALKDPQYQSFALHVLTAVSQVLKVGQLMLLCGDGMSNNGCVALQLKHSDGSDVEPDVFFDVSSSAAAKKREQWSSGGIKHIPLLNQGGSQNSCVLCISFTVSQESQDAEEEQSEAKRMKMEVELVAGHKKLLGASTDGEKENGLLQVSDEKKEEQEFLYFKKMIAFNNKCHGDEVDGAIVLMETDRRVLRFILHVLYGCGSNCCYIAELNDLISSPHDAIEILSMLDLYLVGRYLPNVLPIISKIASRVVEIVSDPVEYIFTVRSMFHSTRYWDLGGSFTGRLLQHLLCLPFWQRISDPEKQLAIIKAACSDPSRALIFRMWTNILVDRLFSN